MALPGYTYMSHDVARLHLQLHVQKTASAKSHKIKNPYFCILRIASDVFFDADSESPHNHMT